MVCARDATSAAEGPGLGAQRRSVLHPDPCPLPCPLSADVPHYYHNCNCSFLSRSLTASPETGQLHSAHCADETRVPIFISARQRCQTVDNQHCHYYSPAQRSHRPLARRNATPPSTGLGLSSAILRRALRCRPSPSPQATTAALQIDSPLRAHLTASAQCSRRRPAHRMRLILHRALHWTAHAGSAPRNVQGQ